MFIQIFEESVNKIVTLLRFEETFSISRHTIANENMIPSVWRTFPHFEASLAKLGLSRRLRLGRHSEATKSQIEARHEVKIIGDSSSKKDDENGITGWTNN